MDPVSPTDIYDAIKTLEGEIRRLREDYETANSAWGPGVLGVIGLVMMPWIQAAPVLVCAFVWYCARVCSRHHIYYLIKEAEQKRAVLIKKSTNGK